MTSGQSYVRLALLKLRPRAFLCPILRSLSISVWPRQRRSSHANYAAIFSNSTIFQTPFPLDRRWMTCWSCSPKAIHAKKPFFAFDYSPPTKTNSGKSRSIYDPRATNFPVQSWKRSTDVQSMQSQRVDWRSPVTSPRNSQC